MREIHVEDQSTSFLYNIEIIHILSILLLLFYQDTKHLPKEMAQTGRLVKNRVEITKINGNLFRLRMNVNLVSNVLGKMQKRFLFLFLFSCYGHIQNAYNNIFKRLDTPEIFWSEPALQPMYNAIRGNNTKNISFMQYKEEGK